MRRLFLAILLLGCSEELNVVEPDFDLNRMIDQPRGRPFRQSDLFADGRLMRTPPEGTIPREREILPDLVAEGRDERGFATTIPLPLSRQLLDQGRRDFEVVCGACHGLLGDGQSQVALNMELVRPPSLIVPPISDFPPGRVYHAIKEGFGLMPRYDWRLDVERRWGVVAYLRALQRSRQVPLDSLPPELRARAEQELPP